MHATVRRGRGGSPMVATIRLSTGFQSLTQSTAKTTCQPDERRCRVCRFNMLRLKRLSTTGLTSVSQTGGVLYLRGPGYSLARSASA